jgi:hypothetical protein
MKAAKDLSATFVDGRDFATKATTCRRLAGGIGAIPADLLGLTDTERAKLSTARALLDEIAGTYAHAAKLHKRAAEANAKREKEIRAAMKDSFDALSTVADKIALIAFVAPYSLAWVETTTSPQDARYLMDSYLRAELDQLAYSIGRRMPADATTATAVATEWERFQQVRGKLQDKHARAIVSIERLLAAGAAPITKGEH